MITSITTTLDYHDIDMTLDTAGFGIGEGRAQEIRISADN